MESWAPVVGVEVGEVAAAGQPATWQVEDGVLLFMLDGVLLSWLDGVLLCMPGLEGEGGGHREAVVGGVKVRPRRPQSRGWNHHPRCFRAEALAATTVEVLTNPGWVST